MAAKLVDSESVVEETPTEAETAPAVETWPLVVPLSVPIDIGKEHITELTFRRGRMGDIKGLKHGSDIATETITLLASRLCGQPVAVIERLDQDDAGKVSEIVIRFLGKCLTTSVKGSRT